MLQGKFISLKVYIIKEERLKKKKKKGWPSVNTSLAKGRILGRKNEVKAFWSRKPAEAKYSHPVCMHAKSLQSCPTLWDPMNCSLPGASVHGIVMARMLGWVTMPFSRGSSQPRVWIWVSCTAGRFFTVWITRKAQCGPG